MRYNIDKTQKNRTNFPAKDRLLVAVYPRMYCPRCGSREIGLYRLMGDNVVWECRECDVKFKLVFPAYTRF